MPLINTLIKNIVTSAALMMLVVSPFMPLVAQAQTSDILSPQPSGAPTTFSGSATAPVSAQSTFTPSTDSSANSNSIPTGGLTPLTTQSVQQAVSGTPSNASNPSIGSQTTGDAGCGLSSHWDLCITNIVYYISVGLGSSLAYLGAYIFDLAAQLSLNSLAYSIDFISAGWTTVRDIANMAFLFILIYLAFIIMFDAETAGTMSMLATVIIIALVVNFSFFFTRVVIDTGNILAVQFYNAIPGPAVQQTMAVQQTNASNIASNVVGQMGQTKDLTAGIMNALGVQQLLSSDSFKNYANPANNTWGQWFGNLIGLSFLYLSIGAICWILFSAFLAAGIKFIVRIVVLWFLIIASPLAFVAYALKPTRSYYDKWQSLLISHVFYPAFFLFIFFVLSKLVVAMGSASGNNIISSALSSLNGTNTSANGFVASIAVAIGNVGIRLGLVVAVFYLGIKAANELGVMGAKVAENITGRVGGTLLGGAGKLTGAAGRFAIGRPATALSKSASINQAASAKGLQGESGRILLNLTKRLGSATFDPRNAPGATAAKKALEKIAGTAIPTGVAPTKGYAEKAAETSKKREEERKERAAIVREEANKSALKRIDEDIKNGRTHDTADVARVRSLSKKEMESLKAADIEKIAHIISEDKLKLVNDSDKYTDEEKQKVRTLAEPIAKSQKIVADELRKLNDNLVRPASHSAVVTANTARGTTINIGTINAMRADLDAKLNTLRGSLAGAAPGDAEDIKSDMTQIRNALKSVRELTKQVARVQPHNAMGAGEFVSY